VIIQCPKCQTKFSVSSELISELELPRFHCSRCDNVFDLDPRMPTSFEESDMGQLSDPNNSTKTEFEDEPPPPKVNPGLRDTTEMIYSPEIPDKRSSSSTLEMSSDELKKVASAINSEPEKPQKSLEIPKTYSPAKPISAPIENAPDETRSSYTPNTSPYYEPKVEQLSMDLKSDPFLDKKPPSDSMPYGISYGDPMTDSADGLSSKVPSGAFAYAPETPPPEAPQRSAMQNLGLFFMPIIFALICACAMSLYLIKSPNFAEALAGNLGVPLPKFAPAGMYIDDIKYNKITLESGEVIFAVSGRVKNDSLQKFRNVLLEGFAFDHEGHILASAKVSAANGLNDSRIKSLNMEMIKNMQSAKAPKKFELGPNSSQDFLIVLNSEGKVDLSKAQFFSARIHSVIE
jgi:predicted Zn finger-like uncharacterized protein